MAILSKDPEKTAERERVKAEKRAAEEEADRQRERAHQEQLFAASPPGRARAARAAGDRLFQISIPISVTERTAWGVFSGDKQYQKTSQSDPHSVLEQIEAEGWHLEHVGYVFQETGSVSRDKLLSSGQTAAV
jgi:hypothetical protein